MTPFIEIGDSMERSCRILVVEDTETHVLLAKAVLEKFPVEVRIAGNYDQAVDSYRHFCPDLVFMDLQLPAKSGYEITYEMRRLEQEGQKPHVPIVAVTAYLLGDAHEKCKKAGMDDCVSKPLSINLCQGIFDRYIPQWGLKASK